MVPLEVDDVVSKIAAYEASSYNVTLNSKYCNFRNFRNGHIQFFLLSIVRQESAFFCYPSWVFRKLGEATFSTAIPISMFRHKHAFPAPGTVAFIPRYRVALYLIKLVNRYLSFRTLFLVGHAIFYPLFSFDRLVLACFAFIFAAFSSAIILFLSSLGKFLKILYRGSCFIASCSSV